MSDYISHEDMMSIPAREVSDSSKLASNPVVSVIMTTYNHEPYIAQAIEGVMMQRCDLPIELLIGEDCSTDRTRAICTEYQFRYPQSIRVITAEHNVGAHRNFFRLFARARGRYVAICEGDDYWTDQCKIQMQIEFMETHPDYSLCVHNALIIHQDSRTKPHLFHRALPPTLSAQDIIEHDWLVPTASMVLRRTVNTCFSNDFYDFPSSDLALCILAAASGKVRCFKECMSVYRIHLGGCHFRSKMNFEQTLIYWDRMNDMLRSLDHLLGGCYRDSFRRRIDQNCRRKDYLQLRNTLQSLPRLVINTFLYFHYRFCMKIRLHNSRDARHRFKLWNRRQLQK